MRRFHFIISLDNVRTQLKDYGPALQDYGLSTQTLAEYAVQGMIGGDYDVQQAYIENDLAGRNIPFKEVQRVVHLCIDATSDAIQALAPVIGDALCCEQMPNDLMVDCFVGNDMCISVSSDPNDHGPKHHRTTAVAGGWIEPAQLPAAPSQP